MKCPICKKNRLLVPTWKHCNECDPNHRGPSKGVCQAQKKREWKIRARNKEMRRRTGSSPRQTVVLGDNGYITLTDEIWIE